MQTARLAIGSVSILALGALAIGSSPYWLHRNVSSASASPWGAISSFDMNRAEAAQPDDRAKLLELATLKSTVPAEAPAPVSQPVPAPVLAPSVTAETNTPAAAPDSAPAVAGSQDSAPAVADAQPAPAMQQVASAEPEAAAASPAEKADTTDKININTASASALDHIPGAGRIGHAIVSHRPYKTVKDLVSRRILRTSDFQKIQSRISVD